jgi:hypothetical protein
MFARKQLFFPNKLEDGWKVAREPLGKISCRRGWNAMGVEIIVRAI